MSEIKNPSISEKEKLVQDYLELYIRWAKKLKDNNMEFNACRCSHHLLQLLWDANRGLYGMQFENCIHDPEKLKNFAYSMANR